MKKYVLFGIIVFAVSINAQFKDPGFTTESPQNGITNNSSG
jgi:CRISPR/Cas system type I-B associated protein Csh2 (Cas7 group RAMP superfamily)